jgi:tetratricopeptide (TPR) repeat protein
MLATLVDRSLVSSSEAEVGMRFRMLESVRDYFRSKLSPSRAADSAKRFASYFKDIAKTLANPCAGVDEGRNHRRLDEERENIDAVAALCEEWLVSVDDALSLFGSLHLHWTYRGQVRIGISCIDRARAVRTSEPGGAGTLLGLQALCILCQGSGDLDRAEETLDEFLLISEHQTDPEMHFRALTQKGNFLNWFGRFGEAEPSHAGALAIARQIGVPRLIAGAHCNLAESLFGLARFDEAVEHWQLATEFDRVTGNVAGEAMVYLGFAESLRGNPRVASRHLELYLKHIRSIGFERGCCRVAYFTALCAVRLNEIATACELVSSVRAVLERESYDLEAVERLCFTKVDEAIHKAAPEFRANAKETLGLEEAMDLASRFLRATNGHETPIASANSL